MIKMIKFFNRKGVSPIIASVLLVVITIAIGATTMAFIRSLTDNSLNTAKTQGARITCGSEVQLEIPVIADRYQICYSEGTGAMKVLFHNIGSKEVKGFNMIAIHANGTILTKDFTNSSYEIVTNEYQEYNFTLSAAVTGASVNISQWRLEPKIQADPGKEYTICTDSAVVRDTNEILACT
jgi:flagellin-like protein